MKREEYGEGLKSCEIHVTTAATGVQNVIGAEGTEEAEYPHMPQEDGVVYQIVTIEKHTYYNLAGNNWAFEYWCQMTRSSQPRAPIYILQPSMQDTIWTWHYQNTDVVTYWGAVYVPDVPGQEYTFPDDCRPVVLKRPRVWSQLAVLYDGAPSRAWYVKHKIQIRFKPLYVSKSVYGKLLDRYALR